MYGARTETSRNSLTKVKERKKAKELELTNAMIDKLQNYYGIAIRGNSSDLKGMKSAIHANLFHWACWKRRNLHQHCPDRPESWCRFKKDQANGTSHYAPGPDLPDELLHLLNQYFLRLSID